MPEFNVFTLESSGGNDVAFGKGQTRLYVTRNGEIDVFDLATQTRIATWRVANGVGALSLSEDGSFLLVADTQAARLYRVSTADGTILQTYTGSGNPYSEIEVVDATSAIISSLNASGVAQPGLLNLQSGGFSALTSTAAGLSLGGRETMTEDSHLTLISDGGGTVGPLHIFDDRTGTITANTVISAAGFGVQAISEAAGMIAVGIYGQGIALFDLKLNLVKVVNAGFVNGIAFDPTGKTIFFAQTSAVTNGTANVVQYDLTTFTELARYATGTGNAATFTNVDYGNNLLVSADGHYLVLTDPENGAVKLIDVIATGNLPTITGTAGADTLIGTTADELFRPLAGADVMTGGGGADTFRGTLADLNGDRITDFAVTDRISVSDGAYSTLTFVRDGAALTINGTATISVGLGTFRLVTTANSSGTDLIAARPWSGLNDFNGDGHSDILFRSRDGQVQTWQVTGNLLGNQVQQGVYNTNIDASWRIVETADFNGDDRSDILWRNTNGTFSIWNGLAGGTFSQGSYTDASVGNEWRIAAAADINGDGRAELLFQNISGAISTWRSTGTGFVANSYYHDSPGAGWLVSGLTDLNGDGMADIVWRNVNGGVATWMATRAGFTDGGYYTSIDGRWHIDGLGDFDGDGKSDMLWRNDDGRVSTWLSNGAGFDQGVYNSSAATSWQIAQVGDFNGDGKADILWRNDNGALSTWQSDGRGFVQSVYNATPPTNLLIAAHDFVL